MLTNKVHKYWNEYFEENDSDWLLHYDDIQSLLLEYLEPESRILVLGCGTSSLAPGLANDGFVVVGVDISEVAIAKNLQEYADISQLDFQVQDCTNLLDLEPNSFDAVIDKCFLDSLLFRGGKKNKKRVLSLQVCEGIDHVLKSDGHFIIISCGQNTIKFVKTCFDVQHKHSFNHTTGDIIGRPRSVSLHICHKRILLDDDYHGDFQGTNLFTTFEDLNSYCEYLPERTFLNEHHELISLDDFTTIVAEHSPNNNNTTLRYRGKLTFRTKASTSIKFCVALETDPNSIPVYFFEQYALSSWDFLLSLRCGVTVEVHGYPCNFKKRSLVVLGRVLRLVNEVQG